MAEVTDEQLAEIEQQVRLDRLAGYPTMLAEPLVRALRDARAENERLRVTLAAVEAFCDKWEAPTRRRMHAHEWTDMLRAALAYATTRSTCREQVRAVQALHHQQPNPWFPDEGECAHCCCRWPCATARALADGQEPQ